MDALAEHAHALSTAGGHFARTGADVHSTWQGLAACYQAPEAGELLAATGPVRSISDSVGTDLQAAGRALATYAAEVKPIKARLEALRTQAQQLVADIHNYASGGHTTTTMAPSAYTEVGMATPSTDWHDDADLVNRNNALIAQVNQEIAAWMDAQRRCANAIDALYGGIEYRPEDGDGQPRPNEFGYTAQQLRDATSQGAKLPWGTSEQANRGMWGDIGAFFGGAWDGAKQFVAGLGALGGYSNGSFSWATAGQAWSGLAKFTGALAAYGPATFGLGGYLDQAGLIPGLKRGELGQTLANAGKGLIAYDEWSKDPSRAAGTATFNIVSAVVGTKGAGAALRGAGEAAEVSRFATLARVGTVAARTGEAIGKIPTVSDVAQGIIRRLPDFRIPKVPDLHVAEHVDTPISGDVPETSPGTIGDSLGHTPHLPGDGTPLHDSPRVPETPHEPGEHPAPHDAGATPESGKPEPPGRLAAHSPKPPGKDGEIPSDAHGDSTPEPQRVPAHAGAGHDTGPPHPPTEHPSGGGHDTHDGPGSHDVSSENGHSHDLGHQGHENGSTHHGSTPHDGDGAQSVEHTATGPGHDHSNAHPTEPATVKIWHESRMPKTEFRGKAAALQRLSDEGKLYKAHNPVPRDPNITKQYRQDIIDRIYRQYHDRNPEFADRLINRVTRRMSPDHVHELQLGGPDIPENLKMLDRFTNEQIGMRQIRPQIAKLPDGTPVRIELIE